MALVPNYAPITFVDGVTPIDATNMNPSEQAIDAHADAINALDTRVIAEEIQPNIPSVVDGKWIKGVGGAMVWSDITIADVSGLQTSLDAHEIKAAKGVATGYAPLDASAKVPAVNLPPAASLAWEGNWSAATQYDEGDVVILNGRSYMALRPSLNETPLPWSSDAGGGAVDLEFVGIVGGSITNQSSGANNSALLIPFRMTKAWAADVAMVNVATASGNYDFGIYTDAGVRLGSTGSIASTAGQRSSPYTARISGAAGDFWLAVGFAASALRLAGDAGPICQLCRLVVASFPLPANIIPGAVQPAFAPGVISPLV